MTEPLKPVSEPVLLSERHDNVLLLTLNRPHKRNAINNAMWIALREAFTQAQEDDDVAAVVISAAGAHFSAGVDLNDFAGADAEHPFESSARAIAYFEKPLLAAATGTAVGGGATLLLHADVLYVGESLRLRMPFVSLGLVPEWASSYMLQAGIGARKAAELFYTAEWVDAARAQSLGMVNGVFDDDQLLAQTMAKAQEIAQWPVNSLRETKKTLKLMHRAGMEAAFAAEQAGMGRLVGSPENIEAVTAFMEKRKPDFRKLRK